MIRFEISLTVLTVIIPVFFTILLFAIVGFIVVYGLVMPEEKIIKERGKPSGKTIKNNKA